MKPAQWIAVAFAGLVASYGGYLGWRVVDERARAPASVRAIIETMDPAIDAIPPERIAILLRVEDPTFWEDDGIDHATPGAGYTTISQGLGKRIFFRNFSPGFAKLGKLELMILTRFALVPTVPKRDILRAAIASAYLGHDGKGAVTGFAEGARRWFGKELGALTDREFMTLVAMLPAPNLLDPVRHATENAERVARIERLVAGACRPRNLSDVYLEGCAG